MKKKFYILLAGVMLICSTTLAVKKEVVYVRSGSTITKGDSVMISAIRSYADSSLYNVTELVSSDLQKSDLTTLNAADVVIMGRNIGSLAVQGDMGIWDSITKPVISMNMWALRTIRAKWVNNGSTNNFTAADNAFVKVKIRKTDDPIFKGLSKDTVDWWYGSYSHFTNDGSKDNDGGNGEVLVTTLDSLPVLIRWKAGVEFYPGAAHFPLADRVYIGLAGDGGVNYFNFPDDIKQVFFNELARLAGVPIKVLYVRSGATITKGDSITISAIRSYADSSLFQVSELVSSDLQKSDLATLNAADVVIMGRNIGSLAVQGDMGIWDSITKPVISMNMWALRTIRAKWVNNGSTNNFTAADNAFVKVKIRKTDDPIFKGLSKDTVDWWYGSYSHFTNDGSKDNDGGNGEVLVTTLDSLPVFIRWKAGVEYYPGAAHFPLADRVYIGLAGDGGVNYFNFPDNIKEVFFNELCRLGSSKVTELPKRKISSLATLAVSAGKITPAFDGGTLKYTVTLPYGTTAVPTVTATATDPGAAVVITDAVSFSDSATIKVKAEDTTAISTYVVKYVVTPINKDATLASFELSFGELSPAFSSNVTEYTAILPGNTTTFPILRKVKATSELSTVVIHDGTSFDDDATITVTAQDATVVKVYKIDFIWPTGINGQMSKVGIYPSPATEYIRISNAENGTVSIYSISGVLLKQINNIESNSQISVSSLASGTYIIKITSEKGTFNEKFIKK